MSKFKTGYIYALKKHIQRNLKIFYPGSLKRIIPVILFMFCLHLIWIKVSAPAPCGDGQGRLYAPFSSYLRLASEKRFSHGFISTQSQENCYPNGFAIIGLLVNKSGFGPLFLKEPFYFTLLLLIPLSLIFALHPWKDRRVGLLCLLLFFFPPIQICLRSFSPHGFSVLFALGGIRCGN